MSYFLMIGLVIGFLLSNGILGVVFFFGLGGYYFNGIIYYFLFH